MHWLHRHLAQHRRPLLLLLLCRLLLLLLLLLLLPLLLGLGLGVCASQHIIQAALAAPPRQPSTHLRHWRRGRAHACAQQRQGATRQRSRGRRDRRPGRPSSQSAGWARQPPAACRPTLQPIQGCRRRVGGRQLRAHAPRRTAARALEPVGGTAGRRQRWRRRHLGQWQKGAQAHRPCHVQEQGARVKAAAGNSFVELGGPGPAAALCSCSQGLHGGQQKSLHGCLLADEPRGSEQGAARLG